MLLPLLLLLLLLLWDMTRLPDNNIGLFPSLRSMRSQQGQNVFALCGVCKALATSEVLAGCAARPYGRHRLKSESWAYRPQQHSSRGGGFASGDPSKRRSCSPKLATGSAHPCDAQPCRS